ncbi:hypothetical protein Pse7367_0129 [Thalassoporum mexicanum PCC 7367]|uniref:hypothetical protein n=1 Tax=Thalassoporum mexicanum TaxID=3457544 RepID=UPI00029F8976|nr:hypothetical protein [Pseudanabaena sp. PCC 7367]AFY68446.1 hypothetical protein Pse7367_0129 [Pseudanabaena sp. PCC 7367]
MSRKITFGLLWLLLVGYAFFLAPPNQPDTFELIKNLSTGQWQDINPVTIALFNLMGIWPMIYACLMLIDGVGQKVPAWVFLVLSFGVGAFAILPYLALREDNYTFTGSKNALLKVVDSRWTGMAIAVVATLFFLYAIANGDWKAFNQQWVSDRFIHVMSLDFCLLTLLFPWLLGDDMERRGIEDERRFLIFALIPLFGALIYLVTRPPLPDEGEDRSDDLDSGAAAAS